MLVHLRKEKDLEYSGNGNGSFLASLGIATLYALAGGLFFFAKRRPPSAPSLIDLEVRYDAEKDADSTFLVQNLVKIVKMVLSPVEAKIHREAAQLIFVYSNEGWEIRVRNGSERLRHSVRRLLEAKEW